MKPSTTSKAPLALEVLASLSIMEVSVNQVGHFDPATGEVLNHSVDAVALMPAFFQRRKSGHPLTFSLVLLAMQVNATPSMPGKEERKTITTNPREGSKVPLALESLPLGTP